MFTFCSCIRWSLPLTFGHVEKMQPRRPPMTAACDSSLPSVSPRSTALALAAPAPVTTGEDLATYDDLLARVAAAVKPSSVIEDLCVRDAVDDAWEVLRLRRYKAGHLAVIALEQMHAVLKATALDETKQF